MWSKREGYPKADYFKALHPRLEKVVDEKLSSHHLSDRRKSRRIDRSGGGLDASLKEGTAVAIANVDAHVSVPAATVTEPGRMVMIMGTSICHMVLGEEERRVEGMCGVVEDGIIPGLFGFEAGQSGVGDIFAWFLNSCIPEEYCIEAGKRGQSVHQLLEAKAASQNPGSTGCWHWTGGTAIDLFWLMWLCPDC